MSGTFAIDDRDISFVLFDHLRIEELFQHSAYAGFSRDDAEMILRESDRFSKEVIAPTNAKGDAEGCTFKDGEVKLPECFTDLFRQYRDGGWIGLTSSEEMGGSHVPVIVSIACAEGMVSANVAFSTYPGLARGVARVLENHGGEWMREQVAKRLYSGEWLGTMCLTESQAGTAIGDTRTTARKEGDSWLMKGSKIFISGAEHNLTDNIIHLVLARTPDAPKGIKGLSLFVVPKVRIKKDGSLGERNDVTVTGIEEKMGLHGSCTCALNFGDNDQCEALLVGAEGKGIQVMFQLMNEARIGTGLHGLCGATVAYQAALAYAKERVQGVELQNMRDFDAPRVPIIKHPDVMRMLFTMKAQVEGMRALLYKSAYIAEMAHTHPDEAERQKCDKLLGLLTPMCKSHCSDVGFDVTVNCIQVHGGTGYIRETGVEQLLRDVKVASIYEGANGIQALDLVGRKLAKNNGELFILLMDEIGATIDSTKDHPTLGSLATILDEERGRVREVVGQIAQAGMSGDFGFPALVASPFLTMLSNLTIGWLMLQQGVIAHDQLSTLWLDKDIRSEAQRDELLQRSDEAAYLDNKVHTTNFFIKNILMENRGLAAAAINGHREILAARL